MPVQHSFDYITPAGKEFITLEDWVKTLSSADQAAYATAWDAHEALIAKQQADGHLIVTEANKKVYTDEAIELAKRGEFKYVPEEWLVFFDRYQRETGITLDKSVENL